MTTNTERHRELAKEDADRDIRFKKMEIDANIVLISSFVLITVAAVLVLIAIF